VCAFYLLSLAFSELAHWNGETVMKFVHLYEAEICGDQLNQQNYNNGNS
jgi:hypothetical protein